MKIHNRLIAVLSAIVFTMPLLRAQETQQPIDLEARKASIKNLERHISQREERLNELAGDILRLDKRVEEGIAQIVELLASVKDSESSKTRVSNLKEDAIEGLFRMVEDYKRKRATIREKVRTGKTDVPLEELNQDIAVFDEHIEKRVEQILELTKSFTQHQDYQKYVSAGGYGSWGGYWENREISEAWKQNRRDVKKTKMNRKDAIEALKKSIADLERQQNYMREKLRTGKLTPAEEALYNSDMERVGGTMLARQSQLKDLQTDFGQPATKKIGRDRAYELGKLLEDAMADLRSDFYAIFQKYDELNRQRGYISNLKQNLAARKEWIREYEAKQ